MNIEGCRRSDLRMDGKEANASLQTGRRDPGFPPESPGKVALGVKAQLLRHTGHTFPLLQQLGCGFDFQLHQIFVDADSGVLIENTFEAGLADIAEPGKLGDGGLSVDVTVQVTDGLAENNCIRGGGDGGNGPCIGKGEHKLVEIGCQHLGISGHGAEGLQAGPIQVFRIRRWFQMFPDEQQQ